jgi:hypothetical protein
MRNFIPLAKSIFIILFSDMVKTPNSCFSHKGIQMSLEEPG